jgi:hypothetical protein
MGEVARILLDHARRMIDFFGPRMGMLQMRKWAAWYTKGFRDSASVRDALADIASIEDLERLLTRLDPTEPFPANALRAGRAKGGRTQSVSLPEGYLDARDDDTPPRSPHTPEEIAEWERALQAG